MRKSCEVFLVTVTEKIIGLCFGVALFPSEFSRD